MNEADSAGSMNTAPTASGKRIRAVYRPNQKILV